MSKLIKKNFFIGVDISKDTLDLAIIDEKSYGTFKDMKIQNNLQDFNSITKWLKKNKIKKEDCLFCMEHSGTYGLLLFAWLTQEKIDFCVEPGMQIKKSMGISRGKNDKVDARRIADYAFTNRAKLKVFEMPSALILQLKQLLTYRDQIVRIRTSLKNSIRSHLQYQKLSGLLMITQQIEEQIEQQNSIVKQIEAQIVEVIKSDPLMKKNYELAISVKGIGLIVSAFMLVTTNNFSSFETGRKYSCYAGIAPFEHSSGISIKGKTQISQMGNKRIKTLLTNGANSAVIWDKELKLYYDRKRMEGKEHKVVINAIRCKLVNRVFACVKRQTPYVKIYQHNFS